jgi:hypothetical protein
MTDTDSSPQAGGVLRSRVRAPRVASFFSPDAEAARPDSASGSIHDDAVATGLGFRGGTIAGSVHMDQFPAILVEAFGREWFETGSLSLTFRNATISGESVIAMVEVPASRTDSQARAWIERTDGLLAGEGTASVGSPAAPTHLSSADLRPTDPGRLRILAGVRPGVTRLDHRARADSARMASRLAGDPGLDQLGWYAGASPWGAPVASPSALVQLLRNRGTEFGPHIGPAVGLFGAIEIRHLAGPVFLDRDYHVQGEVVAVGESPKTEYAWYDTRAYDDTGTAVASMRMKLRWLKASSPLYAEGAKEQ